MIPFVQLTNECPRNRIHESDKFHAISLLGLEHLAMTCMWFLSLPD